MPSPPGKLRTREHVLPDLALNYLERHVLLCGCSVQRVYSDYGYDFIMSTYNAQGEIEAGIVFFQVKATADLPWDSAGKIPWTVSRRDLRLWLEEDYPVSWWCMVKNRTGLIGFTCRPILPIIQQQSCSAPVRRFVFIFRSPIVSTAEALNESSGARTNFTN